MNPILMKSCISIAMCIILLVSCTPQEEKGKKIKESEQQTRELAIQDSIRADLKREQEIESKRNDSINAVKRQEEIKNSIKITNYYLTRPNSAGGVGAYFYYKNLSNKPIKYLVWSGYPINKVDDAVSCTIRGNSSFRGKDTGPVKKGATGGGHWDCAWYNWEAHKLILTEINIEYMDGSTLQIEGDELFLIGKKK